MNRKLAAIEAAKQYCLQRYSSEDVAEMSNYDILYEVDSEFLREVEEVQLGLMAEFALEEIREITAEIEDWK